MVTEIDNYSPDRLDRQSHLPESSVSVIKKNRHYLSQKLHGPQNILLYEYLNMQ